MAIVEFLIGTTGPFLIDSDDPLYTDPRQLLWRGDMTGMLFTTDIVDNLTSTSTVLVLSAKQGKVLKDLIDGLTTAAVPDSSNKRYVTDAELAILAVTSGVNTGDQTLPTLTTISGTLPVYANNAAAVTGGLSAGQLYRTGADPDVVCVVH